MKTILNFLKYRSIGKPPSLGVRYQCAATAWALPLCLVVGVMLMCNVAQAGFDLDPKLVDKGFRLWTTETWDGNGRTCGTCHIPKEAYNIFPATIKKLSNKELDLVFATNVPGLENIDLIESHALFNIMGASPCQADELECWEANRPHPGPVFRSTMGVFALDITTANTRATFPGTPLLPAVCSDGVANQLPQLGWAGDGSPGTPADPVVCQEHHGFYDAAADGSIRAFCNGAIAQHSTKSLDRIVGEDFRLPTDEELDALDEFQRWLGRRPLTDLENTIQGTVDATEFDLNLLEFKDARVALGRDHYIGPPEIGFAGGGPPPPPNPNAGAGCNACHINAGAMGGIGPGGPANINVNTDVELGSHDIGLAVVGVPLPHDEGASDSFGPPPPIGPGDPTFEEAFNIQSIIEAAQKKGWFHNHRVVDDFEEAIAFYITEDFTEGGGAFTSEQVMRNGNASGSISFPNGDGIEHLGTFLRALNAFYNLRDCERLIDETIERIYARVATKNSIRHCVFNLNHVIRILKQSKHSRLHTNVQFGARNVRATLKFLSNKLTVLHKAGLHGYADVPRFKTIKESIRYMRNSIAVQTSP